MDLLLPPAAAEPVLNFGSFVVTNAMINSWIAVVFFIGVAIVIQAHINKKGSKFINLIEAIIEFFLSEIEKIAGDRKKARQFLPIVGTIFFFILFSNWIGLLPGTGSIGIWGIHEGHTALIPLLRPAASDLNLTLGIALFAVLSSHVIGLMTIGPMNHVSKFINIRGILKAFSKGPMAVIIAIIEFFVGLIEIVSEIAKVASLSLRLFGNIFAGEVLLTVMLGLFAYALPIPFMFLEVLVGLIQATVFAMLTLAYLAVATEDHGHEEKHADEHEPDSQKAVHPESASSHA